MKPGLNPKVELARYEAHLKDLTERGLNRENSEVYVIYDDLVIRLRELVKS